MIERCISPYRAAKLLGCSYENIRMKCVRGEIEGAVKFGDRWMIPVSSPSLPGNMKEEQPKLPELPTDAGIAARVARMREIAKERKRLARENPHIRFVPGGPGTVSAGSKIRK